ncbi:hypothetical protein PNOK_0805800 [Pyrrhoderma noxium]|uniref:Uncharacterized protein n=1 Tax=Pyrrhoderma noxium TaxID=2282107 RepID=A0A286UA31_9AGAM|nr:hypothetical protein PNOK_0805800 [Pyrrhoderma noxium]
MAALMAQNTGTARYTRQIYIPINNKLKLGLNSSCSHRSILRVYYHQKKALKSDHIFFLSCLKNKDGYVDLGVPDGLLYRNGIEKICQVPF